VLDATIRERICFYCGRPAAETWPSGRLTCSHEICKSLAWSRESTDRHGTLRGAGSDVRPRAWLGRRW
jgi:hypothetical protein